MNNRGIRKYKNSKYTRELSRILLIRFPPMGVSKYQCYGLTGNFLPVIVRVNSSRRFKKLRGWYWVEYSVTNRYAKISERMQLYQLDKSMLERMWMRYRTVEIPEYFLGKVVNNNSSNGIEYVTVIDRKSYNLYLFYLNNERKNLLKNIDYVKVKILRFNRYGKLIVNYITDNDGILKIFFKKRTKGEDNEENKQGYEEE